MDDCEFQTSTTCQIWALKHAVENCIKRTFTAREQYKFIALIRLIEETRMCSLSNDSYFHTHKNLERSKGEKDAYEKATNEQRLPAYVALFARAFPTFDTLTLNYKYFDLQLEDYVDFLGTLGRAEGAALGLKTMLGYRSDLFDSDDKLLVFAQSIDFDIKPFTAFLSYTKKDYTGKDSSGHAVSIEWIKCFNNVIESKAFGEKDLYTRMQKDDIWWYNIKRCSLDDRMTPPATERMKQEVKELRDKLDIDENDPRITYRPDTAELRRALHLQKLLNSYEDAAGYVMVQDTNDIGKIINEKQRCHWIIPLKQFYKVVTEMIIPITKNTQLYLRDGYKPFQYRPDDFLNWKNVSTVQEIEKFIYKTDKVLSETEIDALLSEGYKEWRIYNNGNEIKIDDHVEIVSSETFGFVEEFDERKKIVKVRLYLGTSDLTDCKPSEIQFISREPIYLSPEEYSDDEVTSTPAKKQKLRFKIKF